MAKRRAQPQPSPPPETRRPSQLWLVVIGLGLALRLAVAWQPFDFQLKYGPLVDDAFYSLNIARHLAHGDGPTWDGENRTNGFQPLYVFLMVPAYWVWPSDRISPIYAALTLQALVNAALGIFLFRIAKRLFGPGPALFALCCFCFSPYFIFHGLNGLETSFAALCWMLALDLYLGRVKSGRSPRDRLYLAAVLAALVFARIDGALLSIAIAADYILRPWPDSPPRRDRLIALGQIAAVALVLYSPWLIYNLAAFHAVVPRSGAAVRYISELFGDWELTFKTGPFDPGHPPLRFLLGNFLYIFRIRCFGQQYFPVDLVIFLFWRIGQIDALYFLRSLPSSFVLFTAAFAVNRFLERRLDVIFFSTALMFLAYGFYVFGHWFFVRYFYPLELGFLILSAGMFRFVAAKIPQNLRRFALIFLAIFLAYLYYFTGKTALTANPVDKIGNYYNVAQSIDQYLKPEARIGAFQSATIGYFSSHQVINLDGVVNENALRAMQDKKLYDYLVANKITYVVDYSWILEPLLFKSLSPQESQSLKLVSPQEDSIHMYRLTAP